jgi:hypothetical protein
MMNLTVLAPDIVGKILDNALPDHLILFDIAVDPPALWEGQWNLITVRQSLQVHKSKNPGANAGFFSFR